MRKTWTKTLTLHLLATLAVAATCSAHALVFSTSGIQEPERLKSTLLATRDAHLDLDELTVTAAGEWLLVSGSEIHASVNFPAAALAKVQEFLDLGLEIDAVSFTPSGQWAVVAENYLWRTDVPEVDLLTSVIQEWQSQGRRIDELAFTSDNRGWTVISGTLAYSQNVPAEYFDAVFERRHSRRAIQNIAFGPGGRWLVVADQWFASNAVQESMISQLGAWQRADFPIEHAVMGPGNSFLIYGGHFQPDLNDPIMVIENTLGNGGDNIFERMHELGIPGLGLAVIDDHRVVYARGYGTLEADTQRWVRSSSPFPAGSLSKMMTAIGLLSLLEENVLHVGSELGDFQGDVAEWIRLGNNFPEIFGTFDVLPLDIEIRELLSHTANLNNNSIEIHPDHWPGQWSTLETLLGLFCDSAGCSFGRNKQSWYDSSIGTGIHGETFRYSNKGYLVSQAIAETISGQAFEELMAERIFEPLGMADSAYRIDFPAGYDARAAVLHSNGDPVARRWIPNSGAGGLYTTPSDYAQTVIMMMNDGQLPGGPRVLFPYSVDQILTDWSPSTDNGLRYGFGVELMRPTSATSLTAFSHGGAVIGGSSCMEGDQVLNEGIVIMTNASWDQGEQLMAEIRKAFRRAYGWPLASRDYRLSCGS